MHISDDDFETAIEEALRLIPPRFHSALANIGIAMADEPDERELATMHNPHDELLGLYEGTPLPQRTNDYAGVMPDNICCMVIFSDFRQSILLSIYSFFSASFFFCQ